MRSLLLLWVGGVLYAQPASVSGVVVDQTGQALPAVHVRFITGDFGARGGVEAVYGVISDPEGRFTLPNLNPGLYLIYAERTGYLQVLNNVPAITLGLKPGQQITDYTVKMTARAVIMGRVVDESGDPVNGMRVEAEPPGQTSGISFAGQSASTDDRGEFRLVLLPGKYYLKARIFDQRGDVEEIGPDGAVVNPYATTFFPGVSDMHAASLVEAGAGQDVAGIEIRLTRGAASQPEPTFTISGTVAGAPQSASVQVTLMKVVEGGRRSNSTPANADGSFRFERQTPGDYLAQAFLTSGGKIMASPPLPVRLSSTDQTNLQLLLQAGEELAGTLQFTGGASRPQKLTVRLEPADYYRRLPNAHFPSSEVSRDGAFRPADITPGKYKVVVDPMPENGYLKEELVDGKAVDGWVLDFSQGSPGSRLKLTVSGAGGEISGKILDRDGQPLLALVMVFAGTSVESLENGDPTRVIRGDYALHSLRPGKYRLFALDVLQLAQFTLGRSGVEAMRPFFDAGEEIEIKEGDHLTRDLRAFAKLPEKK